MTTEIIPVSKKLQKLIDEANTTFGNAKAQVLRAYHQAVEEGMTPNQAKDLLLEKITVFKKSTIYSFIPVEAKNPAKARAGALSHKKSVPTLEHDASDTVKDEPSRMEHLPDYEGSAVAEWQAQAKAEVIEESTTTLQKSKKIQELEQIILENNEHIKDLKERLRAAEAKLKDYQQPFDAPCKVEIAGHRVPARVHVRPALKEVTNIELDESKLPAGLYA